MSLLYRGTEVVTVFPEELTTDADGNPITRPGATGSCSELSSSRSLRPRMPSGRFRDRIEVPVTARRLTPACSVPNRKSSGKASGTPSKENPGSTTALVTQGISTTSSRGAEQSPDKCCRVCSLDVVLGDLDLALFVDDERGADDALHGLAVHHLLAVGAPGGQHLAVGIGQQREGELLVVAELGELLRLVGGDADDVEPGVVAVRRGCRENRTPPWCIPASMPRDRSRR